MSGPNVWLAQSGIVARSEDVHGDVLETRTGRRRVSSVIPQKLRLGLSMHTAPLDPIGVRFARY